MQTNPGASSFALVPVHDASCCLARPAADRLPAWFATTLGFAAAVAFVCFATILPLAGFWGLGALISVLAALGAMPRPSDRTMAVDPMQIADPGVGTTYRALLTAQAELAETLSARRDTSALSVSLLDRSRDTVVDCGQLALTTNASASYLAHHHRETLAAEAQRLRDQADTTPDAETSRTLDAAATAVAGQLAMLDELVALRDRVHARLELATASLRAVTARVVKLNTLDDASLAPSDTDHAGDMTRTLDALNDAGACVR